MGHVKMFLSPLARTITKVSIYIFQTNDSVELVVNDLDRALLHKLKWFIYKISEDGRQDLGPGHMTSLDSCHEFQSSFQSCQKQVLSPARQIIELDPLQSWQGSKLKVLFNVAGG